MICVYCMLLILYYSGMGHNIRFTARHLGNRLEPETSKLP